MRKKVREKQRGKARYFLGFDGGGTKTDCVLMDGHGAVVASAIAGPSNPLRGGYGKAWAALSAAANEVLASRHLKAHDVHGVCAGIAGAGREAVVRRLTGYLKKKFPSAAIEVTTDLAITLEAAVGEGEGIILVAGTGSGAYGRNLQDKIARAGGRGPWFSDEGSAFDIGRQAVAAAARSEECRGPATSITNHLLKWLSASDWEQLTARAAKSPDEVFPRVFPLVVRLAEAGDAVSRRILSDAADALAGLAAGVIDALEMKDREIIIARAGGTVGRSKLFDAAIGAALHRVSPLARIANIERTPAEAAALRAVRHGTVKAHA